MDVTPEQMPNKPVTSQASSLDTFPPKGTGHSGMIGRVLGGWRITSSKFNPML